MRARGCRAEGAMALTKTIVRLVIREIRVRRADDTQDVSCTIHWPGGCPPTLARQKPWSGALTYKTPEPELAWLGQLAVRYAENS